MVEAAAPEKRRNSGIPSIKINTGPSGPVVTANNVDDDTEYVETEMNPDGFFAEANDQVSSRDQPHSTSKKKL